MHVMTMRGGFRGGLGSALAPARRESALTDFVTRTQVLDLLFDEFVRAADAGVIPRAAYEPLEQRYYALADQVSGLITRLDAVETEQDLAAWQSDAARTRRAVNAWAADVRRALGEGPSGLRLFLLAAASITVIGGVSYVIANRPKGRRRRR